MFKLRMFQLLYFLATFMEAIFCLLEDVFALLSTPFEKMADNLQAKIIELDKKEENKNE